MITNKAYLNPDGTINWNKRAAFMREAQKRANKRKLERLSHKTPKEFRKKASKPKKVDDVKSAKKELDILWSKAVKSRDGGKCLLCGATKNIHAHHWYFTRAQGNSTRWELDNGASLCFACHLYKIHQGAAVYIDKLKQIMINKIGNDGIENLERKHSSVSKFTMDLLKEKREALKRKI